MVYVKLTNPVVASCAVVTVLSSAYPAVGAQLEIESNT